MGGAYDEHLIRDVGGFYLALTAVSIAGIIARSAVVGRIAGLGWAVFGVLHFAYHVTHPDGAFIDRAGNVVTLGISAILGIVLLFPVRTPRVTLLVLHVGAAWLNHRDYADALVVSTENALS